MTKNKKSNSFLQDFFGIFEGLCNRHSRFAKAGVSCFYESEVLNSSFVHLMKFSTENPAFAKRQHVNIQKPINLMNKTIFEITKMDCPSEENLIRIKLDGISSIANLDFDIPNRKLTVFHSGEIDQIEKSVLELNLGGKIISTEKTTQTEFNENSNQKKLLWTVLGINFAFFIIEITTGIISKSMGLVADSLDMLADSFVYGISLFAVGGTLIKKKRIAKLAGYFQITLAIVGFVEVLRRFFGEEKLPDFSTMIIVSIFALIANGVCLYILQMEIHCRDLSFGSIRYPG